MILFKTQLFDLEVKGQGHMKVITVHDTPPYGHAPTYQISISFRYLKQFFLIIFESTYVISDL
jgi:hypothetical protein